MLMCTFCVCDFESLRLCCFFFSSRRRHTRCSRDWSSDVCSSDLGERDHAWGTTDWIAPATWIWLSGQFSERLAFNFTKLSIGKEVVDAGFIHVDGVNRPIVKVDIATEFSKGGGPKSLRAWLMEADGKMHEIEALIIRTARLPFAGSIDQSVSVMYETLAKYRMGDETGYGIAEYLIRGT